MKYFLLSHPLPRNKPPWRQSSPSFHFSAFLGNSPELSPAQLIVLLCWPASPLSALTPRWVSLGIDYTNKFLTLHSACLGLTIRLPRNISLRHKNAFYKVIFNHCTPPLQKNELDKNVTNLYNECRRLPSWLLFACVPHFCVAFGSHCSELGAETNNAWASN